MKNEENIKLRRIHRERYYFADAARARSLSLSALSFLMWKYGCLESRVPLCIHIVKKYCDEKHIFRWYIWIWNIIHYTYMKTKDWTRFGFTLPCRRVSDHTHQMKTIFFKSLYLFSVLLLILKKKGHWRKMNWFRNIVKSIF